MTDKYEFCVSFSGNLNNLFSSCGIPQFWTWRCYMILLRIFYFTRLSDSYIVDNKLTYIQSQGNEIMSTGCNMSITDIRNSKLSMPERTWVF